MSNAKAVLGIGARFETLAPITDDNDGQERVTPAGAIGEVTSVDVYPSQGITYGFGFESTGGSGFLLESELLDPKRFRLIAEEDQGSGAERIIRRLVHVLHPGAVGLIANHHGADRGEEAGQAVTDAKAFLANPATTKCFSEVTQVVVFVSGGLVQSVVTRSLPVDGSACIVVDYDELHDAVNGSSEDYERGKLGCTRKEFDKTATYIW